MKSIFKGETLKFFYSKVWLFWELIILIFSLFLMLSMDKGYNWQKDLLNENQQIEQNLNMTHEELKINDKNDQDILKWKINEKYLSKDNNSIDKNGFISYISNLFSVKGLGLLIIIFPIIFSVGIAKEFENKTIDFVLISPHKRKEFYWGKLLSNFTVIILFLISVLLINMVIGYFYFDRYQFSDTVFFINKNKIVETSATSYMINSLLRSLPYYFVYSFIGFCLAITTRSTVLSLTITLFFALLGNQISGLIPIKNGMIFILPAITDLTNYIDSPTYIQYLDINLWIILLIMIA
ncbi:ABC transporter permease [Vagococcus hydrophili]|uniref:ABC transporter permease subunit n=1 Tax=Vagococcus hydrophili TaxID=2714947 RepID=A0A6G8AUH8_9ENTE|nr:ABC transporter permease subunit [Vagococcus hydrophili]QIL48741.1 ABC transporter permease subunit [Vagococcus hydrophili]